MSDCPFTFTGADFYALCSNALAAALRRRVDEIEALVAARDGAGDSSGEVTEHVATAAARDSDSKAKTKHVRTLLSAMSSEQLCVTVSAADFATARISVVPSVSESQLRHYEQLRQQFSSTNNTQK